MSRLLTRLLLITALTPIVLSITCRIQNSGTSTEEVYENNCAACQLYIKPDKSEQRNCIPLPVPPDWIPSATITVKLNNCVRWEKTDKDGNVLETEIAVYCDTKDKCNVECPKVEVPKPGDDKKKKKKKGKKDKEKEDKSSDGGSVGSAASRLLVLTNVLIAMIWW